MVSLVADAIVEAKGGVLEAAHQEEEGEDITMKDVIINVEQQAAEYERRRRQKYEERRAQMAANNRGKYNGERRVFRRDNRNNTAAAKPAEKAEGASVEETVKEEN